MSTTRHQTRLRWMTGTSTIHLLPYSTSKLYTAIFCSLLTPTEIVIQGLLQRNPNKLEVKPAGEKGRGLFTKAPIKAKAYICEYKCHKSQPPFPRRLRLAVEEEYRRSREGCYILKARDVEGTWWCFDATRNLNQYGRVYESCPGRHGQCSSSTSRTD